MPQNKQRRDSQFFASPQMRGLPGYRNRDDRSGLDPLDTQAEAARMEGTFYRNLFTLRLRTRNPFYLILMFVFGVVPFAGFAYLILGVFFGGGPVAMLLITTPYLLVAGALTINLGLSILQMTGVIPSSGVKPVQQKAKAREKKMPRRRKDFK